MSRSDPTSIPASIPVSSLSTSIRALLLDLDDTILDDGSGILGAWQVVVEFAQQRGIEPAAMRDAIDISTSWFWSDPDREREGRLDLLKARFEIIGRALRSIDRFDVDIAWEAAHLYTAHREATYRPFEWAYDCLERLRRRFDHMALVTNGAARPQRAKIERFRLAPFFDHIQVEGEFGLGKPEPRVFENAADVLGVPPGACLFAGDNYRADVLGPLKCGMHAAWIDVVGRGTQATPPPRPHLTVASLAELTDLLVPPGSS